MLKKILGINWKTTLAGLTALVAVAAKITSDIKTKDFVSVITDLQSLLAEVAGVGIGIGLLVAKDNDTTGAGKEAVKI